MAKQARIRAHKLRDVRLTGWKDQIAGRWSYRRLAADPDWRDGWISFDAVTWNPHDSLVYCGLNSIDGDLLYAFDPKYERFECLNSKQWTDAFDVKIHRTLLIDPAERCLYFATSMLHDADQQREAPGGKVVRYDPMRREYRVLAAPLPHLYIQSIAADWTRGLLYGFTYPAEFLFLLDIRTGAAETLAYLGNAISFAQPHNAVVDSEGWLWGTYAETRAWDETTGTTPVRLFKFHPDGRRFEWFEHGLARRDRPAEFAETRHKQDHGFCDSMLYDGGRYIYAGSTAGVLSRIDTRTAAVEKVAEAMETGRFPALALRDGQLYGGGGIQGRTELVRVDIASGRLDHFDRLEDPDIGDRPARIHEIAVDAEHRLYLGENDNHERSGYLWSAWLG